LFALGDAADPSFKSIGLESKKVRNPSTRGPKNHGTSKESKPPKPTNPEPPSDQKARAQQNNNLSRLNAIVLRGEMPDIFILLSYGTLDIFNMIE